MYPVKMIGRSKHTHKLDMCAGMLERLSTCARVCWSAYQHVRGYAGAPINMCAGAPINMCAGVLERLSTCARVCWSAYQHVRGCAGAPINMCAGVLERLSFLRVLEGLTQTFGKNFQTKDGRKMTKVSGKSMGERDLV